MPSTSLEAHAIESLVGIIGESGFLHSQKCKYSPITRSKGEMRVSGGFTEPFGMSFAMILLVYFQGLVLVLL